jgi:hypothetical protein
VNPIELYQTVVQLLEKHTKGDTMIIDPILEQVFVFNHYSK